MESRDCVLINHRYVCAASCEDGRPLCLFCILYALSRPPFPFTTNSHFYYRSRATVSIRYRFVHQSCLPRRWYRRWYNFAYVIWDNIPRIRFFHRPLSDEARRPTISKEILESRRKPHRRSKAVPSRRHGANLFEYLFEDVETVEIILTNSCRCKRLRSKVPRSSLDQIWARSIDSLPWTRIHVARRHGDPRRQQEWRRAQHRFAIRTLARRMLQEAEELLTVQRFYRRANETVVDRWSDRFDSIRTGYAITTRYMPSTIAISMLALCLLI